MRAVPLICYHCHSALLNADFCPWCKRRQVTQCAQCRAAYRKEQGACPECGTPRRRSQSHRRPTKTASPASPFGSASPSSSSPESSGGDTTHSHAHRKRHRPPWWKEILQRLTFSFSAPHWKPVQWLTLGLLRRCWRCRTWQPVTRFTRKDSAGATRISGTCRSCQISFPPSMHGDVIEGD